jgi:hypothetical protein
MSSLQYFVYPGVGEWLSNNLGYSQAVRVADRIEISGQGKQRIAQSKVAKQWAYTTYRRLGH